jgi:hypothetical protein
VTAVFFHVSSEKAYGK